MELTHHGTARPRESTPQLGPDGPRQARQKAPACTPGLMTADEPRRGLAGDLACFDAGRAHVEPAGRLADDGADALNVRVPATRGAAVRVRHVVAEARPL